MKFEKSKNCRKRWNTIFKRFRKCRNLFRRQLQLMTLSQVVEDVLQLKKDLLQKEQDLIASQKELDRQIQSIRSVDLQEMRVVLVSLADRLKKLEDETDII